MAGARAVPCGIGHACRHGVARFAQGRDVRRRYGQAPVPARVCGGRVADAVEGHRNGGTVRLVAGTGYQQILAFLGGVDHVVNRQGIDGNHRRGQGDVKLMRLGGAVTGLIGQGCGDRLVTISQRAHVRRRNAYAPAAGRVQHGGVVFAVQGHGNHVARLRARHLTGDDQRLAVLGNVHDVVARNDVEGNLRYGGVNQHRGARARRVTCLVGHARRDRRAAVGNACHIRRRNVERPGSVRLHLRGVLIAVEGHGHRLAGFSSRRTAQGQILRRFGRVQHVVAADGVNGHRRRGGIDAELLHRGRPVAVHVGDVHLHAGVAVLQAAQIGCRNGPGPVAVAIHRRGIRFPCKGDGHGLARFNVGGGAGQHQILAFFRRVEHVVVGHAVNADGDRRKIDVNDGADRHRVAGDILRAGLNIQRTVRPLRNVRCRDGRLPAAVRQHRCGIGVAIDGHGHGAARRQIGAGTGHNEVLTVFDDVNHVIARHGVNTQARKLGVYGEVERRRSGIAVRVGDAGRYGEVAVAEGG